LFLIRVEEETEARLVEPPFGEEPTKEPLVVVGLVLAIDDLHFLDQAIESQAYGRVGQPEVRRKRLTKARSSSDRRSIQRLEIVGSIMNKTKDYLHYDFRFIDVNFHFIQ
jgi:hypothetical protein